MADSRWYNLSKITDDNTGGDIFSRIAAKRLQRLADHVTPGNANRSKNHVADVNNAVGKLRRVLHTPPMKIIHRNSHIYGRLFHAVLDRTL